MTTAPALIPRCRSSGDTDPPFDSLGRNCSWFVSGQTHQITPVRRGQVGFALTTMLFPSDPACLTLETVQKHFAHAPNLRWIPREAGLRRFTGDQIRDVQRDRLKTYNLPTGTESWSAEPT